jgi:hypothetical protein
MVAGLAAHDVQDAGRQVGHGARVERGQPLHEAAG